MSEVITSIGSTDSRGTATPTGCSSSGSEYAVTFSSAPSGVSIGDKATMTDEGSYFATFTYRVTAISGSTLTFVYVEDDMWTGATSPCDLLDSMWEQAEVNFYRFYTSLYAWNNDLGNTDVYGSGDDAVGEMHNDEIFYEQCHINNLGSLNSIKLTVHPGSRHNGTPGGGVIVKDGTALAAGTATAIPIVLGCNNLTVEWIDIDCTHATNQSHGVEINASALNNVKLRNMIVRNVTPDNSVVERAGILTIGVSTSTSPAPTRSVLNNFVYNIRCEIDTGSLSEDKDSAGIKTDDTAGTLGSHYYNNTVSVVGTTRGVAYGFEVSEYETLINNIAIGCDDDCFKMLNGSSGLALNRNNLSTDESAADLGSPTNQLTAQTPTTGVRAGYTLGSAGDPSLRNPATIPSEPGYISMAIDRGTPLASPLIDIHGDTRVQGIPAATHTGYWDIGCDETVYSHPFPVTADAATSCNTVVPNNVTADAATVDPTIQGEDVVVTPSTAVTSEAVTVTNGVSLDSYSITPTAVTADAVTVGSLTVTPATATADASVVTGTVTHGSFSVTPTNAASAATTTYFGTVAPSPATAVSKSIDPTVSMVFPPMTVSPSAATCVASSVDPTVLNAVQVSPSAATCVASSVDPTALNGTVTVTATSTCVALSIDPTVDSGSITATPSAATVVTATSASTLLGTISVAAVAAAAIAKTQAPSVQTTVGYITPAGAVCRTVAPIVSLVYPTARVSPAPATALSMAPAPVTVQQTLTLSPGNVAAVVKAIDPTALNGTVTVSGEATMVASTTAPNVVRSTTTITPVGTGAVAKAIDPVVVLSSVTLLPDVATAIGATDVTTVLGSITLAPTHASVVAVTPLPVTFESAIRIDNPVAQCTVMTSGGILIVAPRISPAPSWVRVATNFPTVTTVVPARAGMEYTLPGYRAHFNAIDVLEFTLPVDALHFKVTTPVHYTMPFDYFHYTLNED